MEQTDKQLAVEKLKNASSVLVTVSNNPSVDDLSAAIGFSLLLSKLDKHATAVFSGSIPSAIKFLEPEKRLDTDVGGLRDFIIALDKDKADKLKYKVEDNVVRIFITPYKTRITQADLSFSEGDFNVDAVVALGVSNREDIDNAIKAHGRILHDASVITINSGAKSSNIGVINWQDPGSSSLCEMLVSISESFGSGLLDNQIATAFLTGIVAATERFSNTRTTPKVMTMSAQLMAAGANQQLIASNLLTGPPVISGAPVQTTPDLQDQTSIQISHSENSANQPTPAVATPVPPSQPLPAPPITAATNEPLANESTNVVDEEAESRNKSLKALEDEIAQLAKPPVTDGANTLSPSKIDLQPTINDSKHSIIPESMPPPQLIMPTGPKLEEPSHGYMTPAHGHGPRQFDEDPTLGGTFNATSQQAHEDSVTDLKRGVNTTILSHPGERLPDEPEETQAPSVKAPTVKPLSLPPLSPPAEPTTEFGLGLVQPPPVVVQPSEVQSAPAVEVPAPNPPPKPEPVQPDTSANALGIEEARRAVENALGNAPFDPAHNPIQSLNAQELPHDNPEPPIANPNPAQTFKLPGQ
jgi:nanoRNase/pAp phosphatase (c-di-AMP/oligoRNAs hydrolase)